MIEIVIEEKKKGNLLGLLVQFGGQTPLKLAKDLEKLKIPIIGTSPDSIDIAEGILSSIETWKSSCPEQG